MKVSYTVKFEVEYKNIADIGLREEGIHELVSAAFDEMWLEDQEKFVEDIHVSGRIVKDHG